MGMIVTGFFKPTVGDLKRDIEEIPDDFTLSMGDAKSFSMFVDYENKTVKFDTVKWMNNRIDKIKKYKQRRRKDGK